MFSAQALNTQPTFPIAGIGSVDRHIGAEIIFRALARKKVAKRVSFSSVSEKKSREASFFFER
jgi:hypothetical protein